MRLAALHLTFIISRFHLLASACLHNRLPLSHLACKRSKSRGREAECAMGKACNDTSCFHQNVTSPS
jgi:hypothetical protein